MGFFDYRCMISGLSLKTSKVALVLLEKSGDNRTPIALPVFGQYNRIGAIDMIKENQNTNSILTFFQSKINSGEVKVNWEDAYCQGEYLNKIDTVEQLIACIERCVTMKYDCVTYNNKRIEYGLIDSKIWDAIAHSDFSLTDSTFKTNVTWKEIYKEPFFDYDKLKYQFKNVRAFLNKHSIDWTPPTNPNQHYFEEVKSFIQQAKSKFINEPLIIDSIIACENAFHN